MRSLQSILLAFIVFSFAQLCCRADDSLNKAVELAMLDASNGNSNQAYHLCLENGEKALRIIAQYGKSPVVRTRLAVEFCATTVKGKLGFDTLTDFVIDKENDVSTNAISGLYFAYSARELRQYGSKYLKKNLLQLARNHRMYDSAFPMLAYFGPDKEISQVLNDQYDHDSKDRYASEHNITLDVTLAQIDDQDAQERLSKMLKSGSVDEVMIFLNIVKRIDRPFVLSEAAELLNDQRETHVQRGGIGEAGIPARSLIHLCDDTPVPQHPKPTYLRVCDRALYVLASKAKVDVGVELITYALRLFTNDELAAAYKILKAHFQDMEAKEATQNSH